MSNPSETDRDALVSHMQEITGDSSEVCRNKLERYQWDLERAVAERLREEDDSRLQQEMQREENSHIATENGTGIRHRTTHTGESSSGSSSSNNGRRVESSRRLAKLKLNDGGGIEDVRAFIQRFEADVGARADNEAAPGALTHPRFFVGTYAQALAAAKRDLRFLLVYLHGDDHQDSLRFCRDTLCSPDVVRFLDNNVLFWGCNTNCEEGYRVSQALRENTYPFFGLIVLRQNKMMVIGRLEGFISPQILILRLTNMMRDNEVWLVQERIEREERRSAASLRAQQDRDYQDAVRADAERMQRQAEAEQEAARERNEIARRERRVAGIQLARVELRKSFDSVDARTPTSSAQNGSDAPSRRTESISDDNQVRLSIKLPDGTRLEGRFAREDSIKRVCAFILADDRTPSNFALLQNFPRRELPVVDFCARLGAFADAFAAAQVSANDEPTVVRRLLIEHDLLDSGDAKKTEPQSDHVTLLELGLQRTEMLFVNDLDA